MFTPELLYGTQYSEDFSLTILVIPYYTSYQEFFYLVIDNTAIAKLGIEIIASEAKLE